MRSSRTKTTPFHYFKTSPEIIRLPAIMYVRVSLWRRNVDVVLHECGMDVRHETLRY